MGNLSNIVLNSRWGAKVFTLFHCVAVRVNEVF